MELQRVSSELPAGDKVIIMWRIYQKLSDFACRGMQTVHCMCIKACSIKLRRISFAGKVLEEDHWFFLKLWCSFVFPQQLQLQFIESENQSEFLYS